MSVQPMIAPNGEKHGLINSVGNSVKDDGFKHMTPETRKKAEALRKEEARIVKARYINHQGENERLTKPYMHWAGDPIQTWHFIPNEVYDVPMGLINEVNASGLPRRSDRVLDVNGDPTIVQKKDGGKERIHEFVPVSF